MYIELYFEACTIAEQITDVPFSTHVTASLDHYLYEAEGFKLLGAVNHVLKNIADDIIDPKLQLTAAFPFIAMVMRGE